MRGMQLFIVFFVVYSGLLALSIKGTRIAQGGYVPSDPRHIGLFGQRLARIGTPLPNALKIYNPRVIAIHIDCLSCSLADSVLVEQLFSNRSVLNVVVAPDPDDYKNIQLRVAGARVVYLQPEDIQDLAPQFGPCVFKFDRTMKLAYVQPDKVNAYSREDLDAGQD